MENSVSKIRLSVLWLVVEFTIIANGMLSILYPGVIDQIIAEEIEGMPITSEFLLVAAILFLIPVLMAFLSLTLKDSTNRWANIILGMFHAGFYLFDLTLYLDKPYYILMGIFTVVFSVLIIWYAYKWPKQEA